MVLVGTRVGCYARGMHSAVAVEDNADDDGRRRSTTVDDGRIPMDGDGGGAHRLSSVDDARVMPADCSESNSIVQTVLAAVVVASSKSAAPTPPATNMSVGVYTQTTPSRTVTRPDAAMSLQALATHSHNGILDPAPFYSPPHVRFRMARIKENECSASECSLICNDYWEAGYGRILMVPRVKLAYDHHVLTSYQIHIIHPARRNLTAIRGYVRLGGLPDNPRTDPQDRLFTEEESEPIDFKPGPEYALEICAIRVAKLVFLVQSYEFLDHDEWLHDKMIAFPSLVVEDAVDLPGAFALVLS
ncbi:hypothetical protein C8Q76DRAFT_695460 [Earliella scabrosa]|nr:hypothetical protein C8Q76DRAFT_695460 [Earliella scabrosa]